MASAYGDIDLSVAMKMDPVGLSDWLIVMPVVIPMVAGAVLLMFRKDTAWLGMGAVASLALAFLSSIGLLLQVMEQGPVAMTMGRWLPPFGISFTADLLGASFASLALFVALACAIHSLRDIGVSGRRYGFYTFLNLMMAGVCGAFLTGDVFNLYVWFEVFLISSFGLIVLGSERQQIDGAMKYAILNLVGTTLFLIATGMLYGAFGTLNMADIIVKAPAVREVAPLTTLAALYLLAFAMKAAAFPVNFWLPASYHTPRIVTGALFAGILTKIGVYALIRTFFTFFSPERLVMEDVLAWIAGLTMMIGILGALAMSDIRRLMGFVVVSGIGVMLAGLAVGTPLGVSGTIVYAFHSMLCMSALYLLGGLIREAGGSFSLHELGGLYARLPGLAVMCFILVLAVAGLPPASGLWPKVMLVQATMTGGWPWLTLSILASAILTSIALGRIFLLVFWRPAPEGRDVIAPPAAAYFPLMLILVPVLLLGLYPEPVIALADRATQSLLAPGAYVDAVFPGTGAP